MVDSAWEALPHELQNLVRCALTRAVFDTRDLRMSNAHALCHGLAAWGAAPVTRRGKTERAPFPDLRRCGWPSSEAAMRRSGKSRAELAAAWKLQERNWHEEARLDDELVLTFVPRELWLVVAEIIAEGPDIAGKRLMAAVARLEDVEVPGNKARPGGGPLSASAVCDRRDRVVRLFKIFVALRRDGYPSKLLDSWTHVPARPEVSAPRSMTDRTAPSRRLCRLVFAAHRDVVLRRFRCDSVEELPQRIRAMSSREMRDVRGFRALRLLTMLTILLTTGTRRHAMARLNRDDIQLARVCWDGIPRVALAVRPAKTRPWDEVCFKPLPLPAGRIVEAWMVFVEKCAARPVRGADPLFAGSLINPGRPPGSDAITRLLSGAVGSNGHASKRAGFPRHIAEVAKIGRPGPFTARECTGYSPHALRHAADQLVEHGAPRYLADLGENRITGSVIVKAMCNHSMAEDPHCYKDFGSPQGLERLGGAHH